MKRFLLFFLCGTGVYAQSGGQPVNVPIQNPSFEVSPNPATIYQTIVDTAHNPSCGTVTQGRSQGDTIPGWNATSLRPGAGYALVKWTCTDPPVPDGAYVAFIGYGYKLSQDLHILSQYGVYLLKFSVANWWYSYPGDYSATLWAGSKILCTMSGWALGDFTEIAMPCTSWAHLDGSVPQAELSISFSSGVLCDPSKPLYTEPCEGWPIMLDKVSLTFTPVI